MAKFLDDKGVSKLWNKIKSVFATKNEVNNKANKDHKQAYFAAECDIYTADDNIGITAAAAKKCVNTFALGKTETAVKAQGLVDTSDGSIITARYSNNGNPNPSYYAVWSDATITYASKEEVKNNLGINNLATTKADMAQVDDINQRVISNASEVQQAIKQINSVNQDKITKGDLVFSLSGSTLTITKRY